MTEPVPSSAPRHVIVCGLGELGLCTLERLLALGERVRVIEPDPSPPFAARCEAWGVPLVRGSAREPRCLEAAGIREAQALLALAGEDLTNLAIALAARAANQEIKLVLRLFNERLVRRVERELPRCQVLDVAAVAAPIFAYGCLHADILHCLDIPGGRFLLRRWPVRELPPQALVVPGAAGPGEAPVLVSHVTALVQEEASASRRPATRGDRARRFRQAFGRLRHHDGHDALWVVLGLITLMLAASLAIFPRTLQLSPEQAVYYCVQIITTVGFGDIAGATRSSGVLWFVVLLMVLGSLAMAVLSAYITEKMLAFRLGKLLTLTPVPPRDHFVVVGLGTVGFRTAQALVEAGHACVAIERNAQARFIQRARRAGIPVLVDADVFSALTEANVEEARGLLAVTNDDDTNLELALVTQEVNPQATCVVRQFQTDLANQLELSFGIHLARSPSAIAAPAFAAAAAEDDLLDAFDVGAQMLVAGRLRLATGDAWAGAGADAWHAAGLLPLTARRRGGGWHALDPDGPWRPLEDGDEVVVITRHDRWEALGRGGPVVP